MIQSLLKYKFQVLQSLMYILFVIFFIGCSDSAFPLTGDEAENVTSGSGVFLSIQINTSSESRSGNHIVKHSGSRSETPMPGENGDGPLPGKDNITVNNQVYNENKIKKLDIYFFEDNQNTGINSENAGLINFVHVTFTSDDIIKLDDTSYSVTKNVKELEINKSYSLLAIANAPDEYLKTDAYTDINNLSELRDKIVEKVIVGNNHFDSAETGQSYNLFLMSSAGPDTDNIFILPSNSETNPASVSFNVERLAARIDYKIKSEYTLTSESINKNDKVVITHAMLVNDYKAPEYLFKRVTEGIPAQWDSNIQVSYLGNETMEGVDNSNYVASNYVIDPHTIDNNKTDVDFNHYYPMFDPSQVENSQWIELTPSDNNEFNILSYTHENVSRVTNNATPETSTCVVFKANYILAGLDAGTTFYWYKNMGYTRLNDIEPYLGLPSNTLNDNNISDYGITKYENGVCYYTYFIKHANDGNKDIESPMEHAIVRNNVYRLNVESIYGPGGNGEISVNVSVEPWGSEINVYPDF